MRCMQYKSHTCSTCVTGTLIQRLWHGPRTPCCSQTAQFVHGAGVQASPFSQTPPAATQEAQQQAHRAGAAAAARTTNLSIQKGGGGLMADCEEQAGKRQIPQLTCTTNTHTLTQNGHGTVG